MIQVAPIVAAVVVSSDNCARWLLFPQRTRTIAAADSNRSKHFDSLVNSARPPPTLDWEDERRRPFAGLSNKDNKDQNQIVKINNNFKRFQSTSKGQPVIIGSLVSGPPEWRSPAGGCAALRMHANGRTLALASGEIIR